MPHYLWIKLQQIRYGGMHEFFLKEAVARENEDKEKVFLYAETALIKTIAKAVQNVQYYKELFQNHNLSLKDIQSFKDIKKIPLLEKK